MNEAPAAATASTSCAGVDCDKPASSLACPTCLKLGITTSKFCDQDCFKRSWATHKAVHVQTQVVNGIESGSSQAWLSLCKAADGLYSAYDPFPSRIYTGTLRACYQKNKLHVSGARRRGQAPSNARSQNPRDPSQRRPIPSHVPKPNYADDSMPRVHAACLRADFSTLSQRRP